MKILVVEDEMIIAAKISMFLTELGYEVTAILPRAEEALVHIEENKPHIILLDIQLKGQMDGIELGVQVLKKFGTPVIFLTANSDDATFEKAKAAKPFAFLAKPFRKTDLQRALELTKQLMTDATSQEKHHEPESDHPILLEDRIFIKYHDKMVKILLTDILYIEADRNYCTLATKTKEYLLTMPMKTLEEKLPSSTFMRIHRSYVVNLKQIDEISESRVVVGLKSIDLSKSNRSELLTRIGIV